MKKQKLIVTTNSDCRVDVFLSEETDLTRSYIKKLADEGLIFVNEKSVKSNKKVKENDVVEFSVPEACECQIIPNDMPIDIVYQDDDLAVINKAQGITVHAGNGTNNDTLVNALIFHLDKLSGINGEIRPGIVHRIDKNTSGLLVVAKNDFSHVCLSKQLEDKTCARIYVALLEGNLKTDSGRIETFIGRDNKDRTKMSVTKFGRKAITDYNVLKRFEGYTLCEFSLKTGRTHQIRVHAKYLGHPVVGDKEYGYKNQKFKLNGQLLHAKTLEFVHPRTKEVVTFSAPLPDYFENVLKKLKIVND